MVANELGFGQKLPKIPQKRDSVVEGQLSLAPEPQTDGDKLGVPQIDLTRSSSPVLEAMSARISEDSPGSFNDGNASDDPRADDPPLLPMNERLVKAGC